MWAESPSIATMATSARMTLASLESGAPLPTTMPRAKMVTLAQSTISAPTVCAVQVWLSTAMTTTPAPTTSAIRSKGASTPTAVNHVMTSTLAQNRTPAREDSVWGPCPRIAATAIPAPMTPAFLWPDVLTTTTPIPATTAIPARWQTSAWGGHAARARLSIVMTGISVPTTPAHPMRDAFMPTTSHFAMTTTPAPPRISARRECVSVAGTSIATMATHAPKTFASQTEAVSTKT